MIEFRVLGGIDLHDGDGRELRSVLAQPKRLAVLAYLAAATPRGFHRRDTLLGLFWPDLDESHARGALNRTVHYLRRSLGEAVLVSRGEELGIDAARLRCDVASFDDALHEGRSADALELYRGDLLQGFFLSEASEFDQWLAVERLRLRGRAADAAWRVAEREVNAAHVVSAARRALALSGDDEAALRRCIALLDRAGDRAAALHTYAEFARRLRDEFDAEPAPETAALVEQVRSRATASPVAETEAPTAADRPPALVSASAAPAPRGALPRLTRAAALAGLAALLLLGSAAGIRLLRDGDADARHTAAHAGARGVAVLPFQNLSRGTDDAHLGDAVTDEILTALARVGDLTVIGRASTMRYKEFGGTAAEFAREIGVGTLLLGSVQREGDRVRITARLIDAQTERQLWAETYDRVFADIFAVQTEIAEQIARALHVQVSPEVRARLVAGGTSSPDAYDLFLRGEQRLLAQTNEYELPIRMLQQAVALDPGYARAWATLAFAYAEKARKGWGAEWRDSADAAARRAIALDPSLGLAHAALAHHLMYEGRLRAALGTAQRALALDPGSARVVSVVQSVHFHMGQLDRAHTYARQLIALDPLVPSWYLFASSNLVSLGDTAAARGMLDVHTSRFSDRWATHALASRWHVYLGDHERGEEALRLARLLEPGNDPLAGEYIGFALLLRRRFDEARPYLERAVQAQDRSAARLWLAAVHRQQGERANADALLRQVEEKARAQMADGSESWEPIHAIALASALRGDTEVALSALEQAIDRGWRNVGALRHNPIWDDVRPDRRFERQVRRLEAMNAEMLARLNGVRMNGR